MYATKSSLMARHQPNRVAFIFCVSLLTYLCVAQDLLQLNTYADTHCGQFTDGIGLTLNDFGFCLGFPNGAPNSGLVANCDTSNPDFIHTCGCSFYTNNDCTGATDGSFLGPVVPQGQMQCASNIGTPNQPFNTFRCNGWAQCQRTIGSFTISKFEPVVDNSLFRIFPDEVNDWIVNIESVWGEGNQITAVGADGRILGDIVYRILDPGTPQSPNPSIVHDFMRGCIGEMAGRGATRASIVISNLFDQSLVELDVLCDDSDD